MCADNAVMLPELENAMVDKNVLYIAIRESLKKVDELLKCLKINKTEKLKAVQQNTAMKKAELESVNDL